MGVGELGLNLFSEVPPVGLSYVQDIERQEPAEHRTLLDRPLHAQPSRGQKRIQRPACGTKRADVTDGTHGDFNQSAGIHERLSVRLSLDDAVENFGRRYLAHLAEKMRRILRADPGKSLIEQHLLDIRPVR